jgi:hypothetical protein
VARKASHIPIRQDTSDGPFAKKLIRFLAVGIVNYEGDATPIEPPERFAQASKIRCAETVGRILPEDAATAKRVRRIKIDKITGACIAERILEVRADNPSTPKRIGNSSQVG